MGTRSGAEGVSQVKVLPSEVSTTIWSPADVARIDAARAPAIPLIGRADVRDLLPGVDLWDMWPVQLVDGATARFDGWTLWLVLSAPRAPDPESRHQCARIRLMSQKDADWRDCGLLLPDDANPGSREWAGSALYDPAAQRLTLFYTAAGFRGETRTTVAQRLFQMWATLSVRDGVARASDWCGPTETIKSDGRHYEIVGAVEGAPGAIKGFRDPAHFRDPVTGHDYLYFTSSLAGSSSDWNGVIGVARSTTGRHDGWALLPPVLSADGLNNELERPIMMARDGLYYLFWSTQRKVFAANGPSGPNGLYGAVGPSALGPFTPLNGTGLVAANPPEAPFQSYSWWVTQDLTVHGFADLVGVTSAADIQDDPAWRRAHFAGGPAPAFRLLLDGDRATVRAEAE